MKTYQSASAVDTTVAHPGAVKPFGLAELPETILLHVV
jgi:hypothetical protein